MKHAKLILFIALVLVLSITSTNTSDNVIADTIESKGIDSPAIEFKVSYEEHSRIIIYGDADFETQADGEEWIGAGTELSPYIIQGYNITDINGGVYIYDVSLYFEIRDCLITYPTSVGRTYGIFLSNVTHATVKNCSMNNFAGGIGLIISEGVTIDNCTITNASNFGMWVDRVNNSTINDCVIFNITDGAIEMSGSEYCNITNNRIYDNSGNGIYLYAQSDFCEINGNTIYNNGGPGIQLDNADNITIQDNVAYGNSYLGFECGIDAYSSANCSVIGNELYDNEFAGINLVSSPNWDIIGNTIYNNSDYGIYGVLSENTTIIGNDIYENGWWSLGGPACGIAFGETARWYIEGNNIWNNSVNGIWCQADYTIIKDNMIFDNAEHGIDLNWANNVTISGNTIFGNGWDIVILEIIGQCGIFVDNSDDCVIDSNIIYDNVYNGITIENSDYNNVTNNEIYENAYNGIAGISSMNCNVIGNTIYNNAVDGIRLGSSNDWNITHNIIYDNIECGIRLSSALDCRVYYNDIGWNVENAYDDGNPGDNQWDDNVSVGNWWHDWESGNYTVTGTYHINDTYATKNMYVYNATEMEYEAGTEDIMTWTAYALNPDLYEFYVDEVLFDSGTWDGSDIEIDITEIDNGFHEVILEVYHVSGHSLNGTSNVTVSDTQPPTWDTAPSTPMSVEFGDMFSYDANASDPTDLDIWWLNGTLFAIDSNGVITNATVLAVGDYGLIISVNDTLGHVLTTEITVQVRDTTSPVWIWGEEPQDQLMEFNEGFSLQLYVYDLSAIGEWSVNDTTNFAIDSNGLLTNVTVLESGTYGLLISVEDIYGNPLSIEISITIGEAPSTTPTTTTPTTTPTDTTDPPIDPVLFLALGGGGAVLVVVIVLIGVSKKRGV